ncbi:MAG: CpsB/CapC family capsule biosynthesis tyrosine phosphatase, partial [Gaiellaceae bacterium]
MIDLHSHVLPGLDDGAADLEEALSICRAAAADGIEVLAGTPHVRSDHGTTADSMEAALAELRDAAGDLIRLVPGGEVDLAELSRPAEELARFALGGNPRYLLVETPYVGWPLDLAERLFRLRASGVTPVLAHPERNYEVQSRPDLLESVVAGGTL